MTKCVEEHPEFYGSPEDLEEEEEEGKEELEGNSYSHPPKQTKLHSCEPREPSVRLSVCSSIRCSGFH